MAGQSASIDLVVLLNAMNGSQEWQGTDKRIGSGDGEALESAVIVDMKRLNTKSFDNSVHGSGQKVVVRIISQLEDPLVRDKFDTTPGLEDWGSDCCWQDCQNSRERSHVDRVEGLLEAEVIAFDCDMPKARTIGLLLYLSLLSTPRARQESLIQLPLAEVCVVFHLP